MISQGYLKKLLYYDPETGIFTRNVTSSNAVAGSEAGYKNKEGYVKIKVGNKPFSAHRLAWLYVFGVMPVDMIDHINRDKSDNRISNLREASNQQNQFNQNVRKDNTSGVRGVTWHKLDKKWHARLRVDGVRKTIGVFNNIEDAKKAMNEARVKYHGDFAND